MEEKSQKKNTGLIVTVIVLAVCLLGSFGYIAYDKFLKKEEPKQEEKKQENKKEIEEDNKDKYLCINKSMNKDDSIYLNSLFRCDNEDSITEKALEENGISLNNSDNKYYINVAKKESSSISLGDIYWKLPNITHSSNYNQNGDTVNIVIDNGKLLINDIVVFDKESVKSFIERKVCCAGSYYIVILTENGNVYFSENDISFIGTDYDIKDVTFVKKNIHNIVEFHESINVNDDYYSTIVSAIDALGNSFIID